MVIEPSPKRVLAFVEGLLLCRTEDEALIHIERALAEAGMFQRFAGDVARAADAESVLNAKEVSIEEGPFCLLAAMLLKSAKRSTEELDENWRRPDGSQFFSE